MNEIEPTPHSAGEVAEWLNAPVLKTGGRGSVSWVRIPPSPPSILLIDKAKRTHLRGGFFAFWANAKMAWTSEKNRESVPGHLGEAFQDMVLSPSEYL